MLQGWAKRLADYAVSNGFRSVMIGGAHYFMSYLEQALFAAKVRPLYYFSKRVVVEKQNPDGSVSKVSQFVHDGWVGTEYCETPD